MSSRSRIELSPSLPKERSRSGIVLDVSHPDDGERRRVTIKEPIDSVEPHTDESVKVGKIGWRTLDHELPRGVWLGSGERRAICGEEIPGLFCPDCGHVRHIGATCHESRCPRCWRSWVLKRTKPAAANVSAYARVRASGMRDSSKLYRHHVVISLPPDTLFGGSDPLGAFFRLARWIARMCDAEAGYMVYHPFRIAEEYRGDVWGHERGGGDLLPKGVLDLVSSESRPWEAIEDKLLTFEPHIHMVCVTPFFQSGALTDKIYKKTGIVTHRITAPGQKVSLRAGEAPTAAALAYTLSHCGLIENENGRYRPPIRSFGPVEHFNTSGLEDEITAAIRDVSRDVVGLSLPSGRCSAPVPRDADVPAPADVDVPHVAGEASGGIAGTGALARTELANAESNDMEICGTDYRSIRTARAYLSLPPEEWDVSPSRRAAIKDALATFNEFVERSGIEADDVLPVGPEAPAD